MNEEYVDSEEQLYLCAPHSHSPQLVGLLDYEPFSNDLIIVEPSLIIPKNYFCSAGFVTIKPFASEHPLYRNDAQFSFDVVHGQIPISREEFFAGELPKKPFFSQEKYWEYERLLLASKGWLHFADVIMLSEIVDAGVVHFSSSVSDYFTQHAIHDVQREWDVYKEYTGHQ